MSIPRVALRGEDTVWLVDEGEELRRRVVDVLRIEADRVLIRSGLANGERVCTTVLDTTVDGMPVRIAPEPRR